MRGTNPIRPPVKSDGQELEVQHIFPTLQGEGPFVGHPAIFIRLGGCNLACDFCDTEFEDFAPMAVGDIVKRAQALSVGEHNPQAYQLVVLTGGEPFRQNIVPLCELLLGAGFKVQIETNGTLYRELPAGVHIICSPKNTGDGYHMIREDLLSRIDAFKFIISSRDQRYSTVSDVGQMASNIPVYIQPMDEYDADINKENYACALTLARQNGYILSLQMHKILGIE